MASTATSSRTGVSGICGGSGAASATTGRQRAELSLDYGLALALELPEFRKITGDGRALEARIRQFAAG